MEGSRAALIGAFGKRSGYREMWPECIWGEPGYLDIVSVVSILREYPYAHFHRRCAIGRQNDISKHDA